MSEVKPDVMPEVTELLARLVSIESINPDLVHNGSGELNVARFIQIWLEAHGAQTHWLEGREARPSVVGVWKGSGGGKSIMLNGHTDTVGIEGMTHPFKPNVDGDRMFGRGTYDMKSGVAAMLVAAARAARAGLRGDVIVACVADEEFASIGSDEVIKAFSADAAIVTEPTSLEIVLAHKGFTWAEIETHGTAAHGSRPDLGVDAITKMGKVLVELEEFSDSLRNGPAHPLLGTGSLHAGMSQGGVGYSTYPESCRLTLERRTLPDEPPEYVESELNAILDQLEHEDPQFRATLRMGLSRPPHEIAQGAEIVQLLERHARTALGREPVFSSVPFWTDCAILSGAGIPTVMFGPHGEGAHAAVEWVSLSSTATCAAIYEHVIREFCA
jgi:acetylornithine deacetylase